MKLGALGQSLGFTQNPLACQAANVQVPDWPTVCASQDLVLVIYELCLLQGSQEGKGTNFYPAIVTIQRSFLLLWLLIFISALKVCVEQGRKLRCNDRN